MPTMNRRHVLAAATAAALATAFPRRRAYAADDYDLVIHGGRVIDPARNLDRALDLGIRGGKIAALEPNIPASAATEAIDAAGLLVVPGLIDVHLHARDAELPPEEILRTGGVTTMVDGGSRGADNIEQIIAIAERAPNRLRLLLNIGRLGNNPNGRAEFLDGLEQGDVAKARRAVAEHRRWIIGMKARLSRGVAADRDLDVLRLALDVAGPAEIPIMLHVGDTAHPLPEILALLRPGDIVTHLYAPVNGILDAQGNVLPGVRQARARGVRFDLGHGLNEHFRWDAAERALAQGFAPDTISSDLNVPGRTAQVFDLPNVLSKFLALGMPLEEVIACATSRAAATYKEFADLGTLRVGAPADVTVLENVRGDVEFVDNYGGARTGAQRLAARAVVVAGKRFETKS
jgi:dihydroorotase